MEDYHLLSAYGIEEDPLPNFHVRANTPVVQTALHVLSTPQKYGFKQVYLSAWGRAIFNAVKITELVLRANPGVVRKSSVVTEYEASLNSNIRKVAKMTIKLNFP
jgi:DNA-binding protein